MMGLIGAIIVSLGFPIGIYMAYIDKKRWERLIEAIGKQQKEERKELVFVNEESKMKRCQYCNKPISKEE